MIFISIKFVQIHPCQPRWHWAMSRVAGAMLGDSLLGLAIGLCAHCLYQAHLYQSLLCQSYLYLSVSSLPSISLWHKTLWISPLCFMWVFFVESCSPLLCTGCGYPVLKMLFGSRWSFTSFSIIHAHSFRHTVLPAVHCCVWKAWDGNLF